MAEKNTRRDKDMDVLFKAILSLETLDECYDFFEDLCTMKELADMVQRVEAAKMLLVALGYDAKVANYVGNDWAINVAADAVNAGIAARKSETV